MSIQKINPDAVLSRITALKEIKNRLVFLEKHKEDDFWKVLKTHIEKSISGASVYKDMALDRAGRGEANSSSDLQDAVYSRGQERALKDLLNDVEGQSESLEMVNKNISALEEKLKEAVG